MTITFKHTLDVGGGTYAEIAVALKNALCLILQTIVSAVIVEKSTDWMQSGMFAKVFRSRVTWKTKTGKLKTTMLSEYGAITVPDNQITRHRDKSRHLVSRILLGLEKYERTPKSTKRIYAALVTHCRYRAAQALAGILTRARVSLRALRRYVCIVADTITFSPDPKERQIYELDGTGARIRGEDGRANEVQVMTQRRKDGKINIAGFRVDKWGANWAELVNTILIDEDGKAPLVVTDGDQNIRQALVEKRVDIQTCQWHLIPGIKYAINCDRRKGRKITEAEKKEYIAWAYNILAAIRERTAPPKAIESRMLEMENITRAKGRNAIAAYIRQAAPYLQTCRKRGIRGATTSKVERSMRTLNDRVKHGRYWTHKGLEAVGKLRLAWYYQNWRP